MRKISLSNLFGSILLLSAMGSITAAGILLIKRIFNQKLSAKFHYYIWFLLLLRLVVPFALPSPVNMPQLIPQDSAGQAGWALAGLGPQSIGAESTPAGSASPSAPQAAAPVSFFHGLGFNFQTAALVWLAGALLIALYLLTVNAVLAFRLRNLTPCRRPDVAEVLRQCKWELRIRANVRVFYDKDLKSPMLCGLFRPKILISPEIPGKLSREELRHILLHELSHLKQRDLAVSFLGMLLQAVNWFNPIILYSIHQMKKDCEIACDATALAALGPEENRKYGNTIIATLKMLSESHWVPGTLGFANKFNTRRITMITLFRKASAKWMAAALTLSLLLAGCSSLIGPQNSSNAPSSGTGSQPPVSSAVSSPSASGDASSADAASSSAPSSSSEAPQQAASSAPSDSVSTLLSNIMQDAKAGKVINCTYVAKEPTTIDDVEKAWGKPDSTDWVPSAKGTYATYSKHNLVFGFNKGDALFEVRSFDSRLKTVSLSAVEAAFGKPAYDVTSGSDRIIGYVATKDFKILLVFPQTNGTSDPMLDHYSILNPAGTVNNMADDPGRQW